jgi:hypothetical protein
MKRFLTLALVVGAAWAATPALSFADAFGLFTKGGCCSCCSFCIRPYNAFSPLTCGVADLGCPGGYHLPGIGGCCGPQGSPCGDNGCGAFGTCGARVGFSGVPCDGHGRGGFGFGCCGPVCLGHTPPPGPPVAASPNTCGLWFAPNGPAAQVCNYPVAQGAPSYCAVPGMAVAPVYPNFGAGQPVANHPAAFQGNPYGVQPAAWWGPANTPMGYPMWYNPAYGYPMGR